MDTYTVDVVPGFSGTAATGCRPSVAYRNLAKISHRLYQKLSHRK